MEVAGVDLKSPDGFGQALGEATSMTKLYRKSARSICPEAALTSSTHINSRAFGLRYAPGAGCHFVEKFRSLVILKLLHQVSPKSLQTSGIRLFALRQVGLDTSVVTITRLL